MPRRPRSLVAGHCYHVINRSSHRQTIFETPGDFRAFLAVMAEAGECIPMLFLAVCLMPNHFHFVVRPSANNILSRYMQWVCSTHAGRYRGVYGGSGPIWQGRFKAFPIQEDGHLLATMRYVERNALRAGLVERAERWPWGSLNWRCTGRGPLAIEDPPGGLPPGWPEWVNTPQSSAEVEAIRKCANRQRPFGDADWARRMAAH